MAILATGVTTSQVVSSVSSGGIIERGSNANGEYVKFADGTMICTQQASLNAGTATARGNFFVGSSGYKWTYPASFISAPSYSLQGVWNDSTDSSAIQSWLVFDRCLASDLSVSPSYRIMATGTWSSLIFHVKVTAIGRWK